MTDMALTPACVLLVEDEVIIRSLLADELRHAGLCVVEASNADEAWAYLQAGNRPGLLFSDIHMPGSMDGIALARLVLTNYPETKIIVTSGNPGPRSFSDVGVFLSKPYRLERAAKLALQSLGRTAAV